MTKRKVLIVNAKTGVSEIGTIDRDEPFYALEPLPRSLIDEFDDLKNKLRGQGITVD